MHNLNLKHLRYFWVVASHGSITKASEVLHLTPQTISGQLRLLEEDSGAKLFDKVGRNLVLSDSVATASVGQSRHRTTCLKLRTIYQRPTYFRFPNVCGCPATTDYRMFLWKACSL